MIEYQYFVLLLNLITFISFFPIEIEPFTHHSSVIEYEYEFGYHTNTDMDRKDKKDRI